MKGDMPLPEATRYEMIKSQILILMMQAALLSSIREHVPGPMTVLDSLHKQSSVLTDILKEYQKRYEFEDDAWFLDMET